jgi:hypothetical protein
MNIVCREVLRYQKNLMYIHGHTQNLRNVQSHVVVDISQEMSHASNKERRKLLTMDYATHHKNQLNGKNVDFSTVHHNGLKVSGVNVQHHVDKMEQENVKFIVRKSVLMGKS